MAWHVERKEGNWRNSVFGSVLVGSNEAKLVLRACAGRRVCHKLCGEGRRGWTAGLSALERTEAVWIS